jgi:rubrerythrin
VDAAEPVNPPQAAEVHDDLDTEDGHGAAPRRFMASALARAVREGWCCRNCGGGFCLHVSPSRCPACGARSDSRKRPGREPEGDT